MPINVIALHANALANRHSAVEADLQSWLANDQPSLSQWLSTIPQETRGLVAGALVKLAVEKGLHSIITYMVNSPDPALRESLSTPYATDQWTPADRAAHCGRAKVMEELSFGGDAVLASMAKPDRVEQITPAQRAVQRGHTGIIRVLAAAGRRNGAILDSLVEPDPSEHLTLAQRAARDGRGGVIEVLADTENRRLLASLAGRDVQGGQTPAQMAFEHGRTEVIQTLEDTADPHVMASLADIDLGDGSRPGTVANRYPEAAKALRDALRDERVMGQASHDLDRQQGRAETKALHHDLCCPILAMPFGLRGRWRPVHLTNAGPRDGEATHQPQQCVSFKCAMDLLAQHGKDPFTRKAVVGFVEAPLRRGLVRAVLSAYETHEGNPDAARGLALAQHKAYSSAVASQVDANRESALRAQPVVLGGAAAAAAARAPSRVPHYRTVLEVLDSGTANASHGSRRSAAP